MEPQYQSLGVQGYYGLSSHKTQLWLKAEIVNSATSTEGKIPILVFRS